MVLGVVPTILAAFSVNRHRQHSYKYNTLLQRSRLQAKKSAFDDSIYGSFDEGYVGVSRTNQDPLSLYYRIYNSNNKTPSKKKKKKKFPLVVLHGGP